MGCVLLASKVEECPRRIREVVIVFVHLYRRRRLEVGWDRDSTDNADDDNNDETKKKRQRLTDEEKLNLLRYQHPLMPHSRLYTEWSEALTQAETEILRQLGFTLYWIPDHHPHKFILYFVRVLGLDGDGGGDGGGDGDGESDAASKNDGGRDDISVAQRAWNYCNDASLLDLSVRYEPEIVACAAILLATTNGPKGETQTRNANALPLTPRPWWEVFVGPGRGDDLVAVCNAILALQESSDGGGNSSAGMMQAMRGFVPSLVERGSFNDPGSFVWDALEDSVV